ncbi:MAG TPA: cytochrome c biogenesis protein DipZ [Thermoleophilaceae bacterium]|nr:cytochrome c biogenesis protein DipZ [Thermoleophilaceae bacterium]
MAVLVLFAFLAGAATALSPCVLPVLPVALSAGVTGGRRRPLGVVAGLVLSFTFATVALVYVISALGLPDDLVRNLAIAVLAGFGVMLILPRAAARFEAALGRLTRRGPARPQGDGFGSGLLLGASLGLVYAPCAGPILAGVITVSASQDFTAGRLAVALSYGAGTAVVLYALMLGGRRLIGPITRRGAHLQPAIGAVMVAVAVLMAAELDIRFQTEIADNLPAWAVNPSKELEESSAARERLADLRGGGGGLVAQAAEPTPRGSNLPALAAAPEITGTQRWFNTPGGRPLSLASLRGEVVLIDFWTYSCINCIRTLPHLKAWDQRYRNAGLNIIGLHAPEFPFERDADNVDRAVRQNGLRYAVAQDNDFATWTAYQNQFWPAKYLIDSRGRVRYVHFGEGAYEETERAIRSLLAEAGRQRLGARTRARADAPSAASTPESYLGARRAERVVNGPLVEGRSDFTLPSGLPARLPLHHLGFEGRWAIDADRAAAVGTDARLHLRFGARRVFLVLGSTAGPREVGVAVDGRRRRTVRVTAHRLYEIVTLARPGSHLLTLTPESGTEAYAFTFG